MNGEFRFLMYRSAEEDVAVNAVIRDETVWLTQKTMAELFGVQPPAINKHLKNIFNEGELDEGELEIGQAASMIRTVEPVGQIMAQMIAGYNAAADGLTEIRF